MGPEEREEEEAPQPAVLEKEEEGSCRRSTVCREEAAELLPPADAAGLPVSLQRMLLVLTVSYTLTLFWIRDQF